MAQAIIIDSKLRLVFETGLNGQGKPVYKSKTYNSVKQSATADQLFTVGQAIAGLSSYPLTELNRNDSFDILG
ncbi:MULTISPECIES: DUF1659 domain-containing protein [Cytobacillus]|jgi:Protein of unknown function (DUF1659)|uniref:DUF1659 domain-containing protein n=2 Tax=Cytobacillus TaxID=2675230 RepID=A0A160MGP8_9BACI|nr:MULTISPECIES: DUF1659 domain-containing protein [Cytobacillus]EFV78068.1 hypothetical protein HMPREF1013_01753 [Bacillus sp. 2_A_57_CT2]AND42567.1 hypothetical protein A361_26560 [Cytobacillus oceanisediminis 2691]MBU8772446.1 DUF1659 domain-containing protein [Cytobacillus oceanisediminis]MBY0157770.1 DUF1659 domain-containing protein [Cytobacillus firmus]MCM3243815.1 DUF1659 domain-containing protein [Cytobacillus oceanisediminis]